MDEKLQQIFCVMPNVDKVITYRTNTDLRKMIKSTYLKQMQNLLNVEIQINDTQLSVPDPLSLPPIKVQENNLSERLDMLLQDNSSLLNVLHLI